MTHDSVIDTRRNDVEMRAHQAALAVCESAGIRLLGNEAQVTFQLLRPFQVAVAEITEASLQDLLRRRVYIPRRMGARESESLFFAHPAGLLGYWLVDRFGNTVVASWPFDQGLVEEIAGDFGLSLHCE